MKKIEIRLFCSKCGNILEIYEPEVLGKKDFVLLVKPCETCKKDERERLREICRESNP